MGSLITSVELNTLNDNFYLSGIIDNASNFMYECSSTNVNKIDLGNYNSPKNLTICSDSMALYICGKYLNSSGEPMHFLKKYSNGALLNYSQDLSLYSHYVMGHSFTTDGTVTSMQLLNGSLYLGINTVHYETMHTPRYYFVVNEVTSETIRQIGNIRYNDGFDLNRLLVIYGNLAFTTKDILNSLYMLR